MRFGYTAALLLVGLSLCVPVAHAAEPAIPLNRHLVNGDFSKPLSEGWTTQAADIAGEHSITATPESGAVVRKEMCGKATLVQEFALKTAELILSTRVRFPAETTEPDYYSTASFRVGYLDDDGKQLAETRIYHAAGTPPWKSSDTLHLVAVTDIGKWKDYKLNMGQELRTYLGIIDATRVRRLRISLESFCSGKDTCSGLYQMAEVSATYVKFETPTYGTGKRSK